MPLTTDIEIEHLTDRFLSLILPKSEWTHEAHFAVALCLIQRESCTPEQDMPRLIKVYNEATGVVNSDTEGYHETITLASLRAARSVMSNDGENTPLHETLTTLMKSKFGQSNWLFEFWTKERLFSVEARKQWVEPDLKPLAF